MTALSIWLNVSETDTALDESGGDWIEMDLDNDSLIFSNGSDVVADGEPIPTQSQLISAGVVLTGIQQIVPKYFLADVSANILREISLMGDTTGRYVVAFEFDDATATEPVLEIWDDDTLLTIDGTTLGAGTASNSWWKGITTTAGSPGASWSGFALAGSSSSHYLSLNNGSGALVADGVLYCNLKIIVPSSASVGLSTNPVIVVKYTSN